MGSSVSISESARIIRTKKIAIFATGALFSFLSIGLSSFLIYKFFGSYKESGIEDICIQKIERQGFSIERLEDKLIVSNPSNDQIENNVIRTGLFMPFCATYSILDFCSGTKCEKPGITMTLLSERVRANNLK